MDQGKRSSKAMFVEQVSETAKRLIVSTQNESDILKSNCCIKHPIFAPTLAVKSVYGGRTFEFSKNFSNS
jgi:hypothetical protein